MQLFFLPLGIWTEQLVSLIEFLQKDDQGFLIKGFERDWPCFPRTDSKEKKAFAQMEKRGRSSEIRDEAGIEEE